MPLVAQLGGGTVLGQEAYQIWAALRPSSGLPLRGIPRLVGRSLRWAGTIRSHPLLAMDVSHPRSPLDTPVPVRGPFEPSGESPPRPAARCGKDGEASLAGGRGASLPTENRLGLFTGQQLDLDGVRLLIVGDGLLGLWFSPPCCLSCPRQVQALLRPNTPGVGLPSPTPWSEGPGVRYRRRAMPTASTSPCAAPAGRPSVAIS